MGKMGKTYQLQHEKSENNVLINIWHGLSSFRVCFSSEIQHGTLHMLSKLPDTKIYSKPSGCFCRCVGVCMVDLDVTYLKRKTKASEMVQRV